MNGRSLGPILVVAGLLCIIFIDWLSRYYSTVEKWALLIVAFILIGAGSLLMKIHYIDTSGAIGATLLGAGIILIIINIATSIPKIPMWLPDALIISAIIATMSNIDFEEKILGVSGSLLLIIGKAVGSTCVGLFVYWIFVKLNVLSALLMIFEDADKLLIISLILYVIGSVTRSFAIELSLGRPTRAIRNAISTAFWDTLGIGIIAFILDAINIVGPGWEIFLAGIWRAVGVLFVAMILAILLIRTEETSLPGLANISVGTEIYSLPKTQSLVLPGDIELIVQGGSYIIPLIRDGSAEGIFILGEISYSVELDGRNFRGEADRICVVMDEGACRQILSELSLQLESGAAYFDEVFSSAKEMLDAIRRKFGKESFVDIPFIKAYSGRGMEYVKVGPITVIETERGEYVKVGPIKVQEGEPERVKAPRETLISISDLDKGWVFMSVKGDRVKIWWDDAVISSSPRKISIKRGRLAARVGPQEYKFVWGDTVIKVEQNSAKIVTKGMVLKVDPPYVKVVQGSNVIKIADEALAEEILSTLKENLSELSQNILEGRHLDKLIELLKEIKEKIIRRNYFDYRG